MGNKYISFDGDGCLLSLVAPNTNDVDEPFRGKRFSEIFSAIYEKNKQDIETFSRPVDAWFAASREAMGICSPSFVSLLKDLGCTSEDHVYLIPFTNRQDLGIDSTNASQNDNGSVIPVFKCLADSPVVKDAFSNFNVDMETMSDIAEKKTGESVLFEAGYDYHNQRLTASIETEIRKNPQSIYMKLLKRLGFDGDVEEPVNLPPVAGWIQDDSKISLILTQIHKIAAANKGKDVTLHVVDDKPYILRSIQVWLEANKSLVPNNVTVKFQQSTGETDLKKIKTKEGIEKTAFTAMLKGEGERVLPYKDIALLMFLYGVKIRGTTEKKEEKSIAVGIPCKFQFSNLISDDPAKPIPENISQTSEFIKNCSAYLLNPEKWSDLFPDFDENQDDPYQYLNITANEYSGFKKTIWTYLQNSDTIKEQAFYKNVEKAVFQIEKLLKNQAALEDAVSEAVNHGHDSNVSDNKYQTLKLVIERVNQLPNMDDTTALSKAGFDTMNILLNGHCNQAGATLICKLILDKTITRESTSVEFYKIAFEIIPYLKEKQIKELLAQLNDDEREKLKLHRDLRKNSLLHRVLGNSTFPENEVYTQVYQVLKLGVDPTAVGEVNQKNKTAAMLTDSIPVKELLANYEAIKDKLSEEPFSEEIRRLSDERSKDKINIEAESLKRKHPEKSLDKIKKELQQARQAAYEFEIKQLNFEKTGEEMHGKAKGFKGRKKEKGLLAALTGIVAHMNDTNARARQFEESAKAAGLTVDAAEHLLARLEKEPTLLDPTRAEILIQLKKSSDPLAQHRSAWFFQKFGTTASERRYELLLELSNLSLTDLTPMEVMEYKVREVIGELESTYKKRSDKEGYTEELSNLQKQITQLNTILNAYVHTLNQEERQTWATPGSKEQLSYMQGDKTNQITFDEFYNFVNGLPSSIETKNLIANYFYGVSLVSGGALLEKLGIPKEQVNMNLMIKFIGQCQITVNLTKAEILVRLEEFKKEKQDDRFLNARGSKDLGKILSKCVLNLDETERLEYEARKSIHILQEKQQELKKRGEIEAAVALSNAVIVFTDAVNNKIKVNDFVSNGLLTGELSQHRGWIKQGETDTVKKIRKASDAVDAYLTEALRSRLVIMLPLDYDSDSDYRDDSDFTV